MARLPALVAKRNRQPPRGNLKSEPVIAGRARVWLVAGALCSFAIALLHLVIIFVGAPAYFYFGAASLAVQAERGSPVPALITGALTLLFVLKGAYALSGAGLLAPFPLLRTVLPIITAIYVLRGLVLVPDLIRLAQGAPYPARQAVFSAVSLGIGLVHLMGVAARGRSRTA